MKKVNFSAYLSKNVSHCTKIIFFEWEFSQNIGIIDLKNVHFEEYLKVLEGLPRRNCSRICIEHPPIFFAMLFVLSPDVAFAQGPVHTHLQSLVL